MKNAKTKVVMITGREYFFKEEKDVIEREIRINYYPPYFYPWQNLKKLNTLVAFNFDDPKNLGKMRDCEHKRSVLYVEPIIMKEKKKEEPPKPIESTETVEESDNDTNVMSNEKTPENPLETVKSEQVEQKQENETKSTNNPLKLKSLDEVQDKKPVEEKKTAYPINKNIGKTKMKEKELAMRKSESDIYNPFAEDEFDK